MHCKDARSMFSLYLDGRLSGSQMQRLSAHMQECIGCGSAYSSLVQSQALVSALAPKVAPPDLALRIRLAISYQQSMTFKRRLQGLWTRFENQMNSLMLPATGGLVTALLIFGLLIGLFGLPGRLAAADQVPTLLYVPPRLAATPFASEFEPVRTDGSIVVEAYVDENGRVADYRILSGQPSQDQRRELDRQLIFTVFQPAISFGQPAAGRVVLSFASVNVKG